jgi:UPF0716 protein FxsA
MSLFHWLFLIFLSVPLAEIYVLLEMGSIIGALPTVGAVVLTAVIGAGLVRVQGFSTVMRIRASLERGELPAIALLEGAFLLVAGALLLTPGFLTDALGFAFLYRPLRLFIIQRLLIDRLVEAQRRASESEGSTIIEGEYRREDEKPKQNRRLP